MITKIQNTLYATTKEGWVPESILDAFLFSQCALESKNYYSFCPMILHEMCVCRESVL